VKTETGGVLTRVDSLGDYVFRFSDDDGKTWSDRRYPVPVREFACDKHNVYGGKVRFFWNVGRPLLVAGDDARRPKWAAGREIDTGEGKAVAWSEPEILLYDDDPFARMSYPDMIRHGENWHFTETNKAEGRFQHGCLGAWTNVGNEYAIGRCDGGRRPRGTADGRA
jgi:hypothetical protein